MKYQAIDNQLFIENRKNFVSSIEPKSITLFNSNDQMPRNGDSTFFFRQNSDIFYLTGIAQENTILVIFPECPDENYREALFIKKTSPQIAVWEGNKHTLEEASEISGIKKVYWNEEFSTILPLLMNRCKHCYLNLNENDRFNSPVVYKELRFANEMRASYPATQFERSGPIMAALRAVKADIEIEQMKVAMDITEKAFRRLLKFVKPGVMEYEIEAEIAHEFLKNGAAGNAYYPIIASGAGSCVLHYDKNDQECKDGDVILMDFGAEYANYAADLTRTLPINGKFTDRQKDVYEAVLRVMKEVTKLLVPGTILDEYHKEVGKVMEKELIQLKLITEYDVKNQDPKNPAYKKYFMHGTSHFLGLDVHDIGNRHEPMKEGMVFTCEPGIYIPEENLGIRLENDLVIKAGEPLDLMASIPIEIDEIETLMNE